MGRRDSTCVIAVLFATTLLLPAFVDAQRRQPEPRPFPRPGDSGRGTAEAPPPQPAPVAQAPGALGAGTEAVPTEATLGFPIYPSAQFITSYDAGRGQRYYLFGTNSSYQEMVNYYGVVLDERGDRVFDAPPTHIFEIGRFREEEMAFPPGVTVKDYTWNGAAGYLNPSRDPEWFKTIIQIVPAPAGQPR